MKILDRHIARTFLLVLAGSMVAFVAIFIIMNLTEQMDRFIDENVPVRAVLLYYLYFTPFILVLTLPIGMLLASLSTIGGLVRSNELTAIKASGVSIYRPIGTFTVLAIFVTAFSFLVSELIVPRANERMEMVWNRYVTKQGAISRTETVNRTLDLGSGTLLFLRNWDSAAAAGQHATLSSSEGIRIERVIQAERIRHTEAGQWRLDNATIREWVDGAETYIHHDRWIADLPGLDPDELSARHRDPEEMGFSDLLEFVRRGRERGRYITRALVDLHMKVALPFANLIIVLFGSALAATRRRTGLAVGFTTSIIICFTYYVVMRTGQAFGYNGDLQPMLAAWAGNLIFGVLSLYFLFRARF